MEVASATSQQIFMFEDKVLLTQAKYPNILTNFTKFSFIFPPPSSGCSEDWLCSPWWQVQSAWMLFEIQPHLQQVMAVLITREETTGASEGLPYIMVVPAGDPRI